MIDEITEIFHGDHSFLSTRNDALLPLLADLHILQIHGPQRLLLAVSAGRGPLIITHEFGSGIGAGHCHLLKGLDPACHGCFSIQAVKAAREEIQLIRREVPSLHSNSQGFFVIVVRALHQVVAFFHGAAPGVFALLGLPLPLLVIDGVHPPCQKIVLILVLFLAFLSVAVIEQKLHQVVVSHSGRQMQRSVAVIVLLRGFRFVRQQHLHALLAVEPHSVVDRVVVRHLVDQCLSIRICILLDEVLKGLGIACTRSHVNGLQFTGGLPFGDSRLGLDFCSCFHQELHTCQGLVVISDIVCLIEPRPFLGSDGLATAGVQ
mmetsp:Transcript_45585/g.99298  ORF Transcript_45585/g.99298 Transcript_45585/m.99298 type:complete len:319 (-) Transcript_45585:189-1145(-)